MPKAKTLIVAAGLIRETVGTGYLSLLAYQMGAWMVDDSVAFQMALGDWYLEAGKRVLEVCVLAFVFGIVAHLFNRWALRSRRPIAKLLTGIASGAICVSGLVGAVEFALRKPYM